MFSFQRLGAWLVAVAIAMVCWVQPATAAADCRPAAKGLQLRSDKVAWVISPCGGGIESIQLLGNQFEMKTARDVSKLPKWAQAKFREGPLELIESWNSKWDPYRAILNGVKLTKIEVEARETPGAPTKKEVHADIDALFAGHSLYGVLTASKSSVVLAWPDPALVKSPLYVVREYKLVDGKPFALDMATEVHNFGVSALSFSVRHKLTAYRDPNADSGGIFAALTGPADLKGAGFHVSAETVHLDTTELADADPEDRARGGVPDWIATDSRYFLLAEMPKKGWAKGTSSSMADLGNGIVETTLQSQGEALGPGGSGCVPAWYAKHWQGTACADDFSKLGLKQNTTEPVAAPFLEAAKLRGAADAPATDAAIARVRGRRVARFESRAFTGPKRLELLRDTADSLDESIDFGWFGMIAKPLLWVLKFFQGLTGNWPVAILLLTVCVKGVLWPVTGKSLKSMRKMQTVKPELDRIKAKLEEEARREGKDRPDPDKLNKETFALYKRHGVNPLGGCLPMFVQMPVYIALYRTIYSSVELFNQPLFGWVTDLTQRDPYFVLPLLLGAAMFVQTRLTPQTGGDETQRKIMMWVMPVMFTVMMAWLPSGLTLYILANTVMSSVQTLWLHRSETKADDQPAAAA
jgi:YidC/Oxa1 family membrane protein insertase